MQLPLLSAGIFAASLAPDEKRLWIQKVEEALIRATEEAFLRGTVKLVVVVDYSRVPLETMI